MKKITFGLETVTELCPPITVQVDGTEVTIAFYNWNGNCIAYCEQEPFLSENEGSPILTLTAEEAWDGMYTVCRDGLGWPELHAVRFADLHIFWWNRPAWAEKHFPNKVMKRW